MKLLLILLLILSAACLLSLRGRRNQPGLAALRGWSYAHRGLHGSGIPENSMAAFRAALEAGYGIELDIHLLKDGSLAVIHDSSLLRTTGREGSIEDLTAPELKDYRLEGTDETIPLFSQVLKLYAGRAPLIIELKAAGSNHAALCEAACKAMEGYCGDWCMESFDPRCVYWLKKHRPDIIRGQLAENFVVNKKSPLHPVLKFILTHQLENFLILPDFASYQYKDRKNLSNFLVRKLWGVQGVTWTLQSQAEYDSAVAEGYLPIFEGFRP